MRDVVQINVSIETWGPKQRMILDCDARASKLFKACAWLAVRPCNLRSFDCQRASSRDSAPFSASTWPPRCTYETIRYQSLPAYKTHFRREATEWVFCPHRKLLRAANSRELLLLPILLLLLCAYRYGQWLRYFWCYCYCCYSFSSSSYYSSSAAVASSSSANRYGIGQ